MPIGTIQQSDNLNAQSTVLTNSSVPVASVFVSLNAEVLVFVGPVVVVEGCVQGSWSQLSASSCYSPTPPDPERQEKGTKTIFKNLCYDTE